MKPKPTEHRDSSRTASPIHPATPVNMPRIAVVDQRPPRRVRVVRRSGNALWRSRPFELGLGVLGLILLLSVFVLTPALPEDDPVPEQVQLQFAQTVTDYPLDIFYEAEQGGKEFCLAVKIPVNTFVVEIVVVQLPERT